MAGATDEACDMLATERSEVADFVALGIILSVALVLFWTQWVRTDLTALMVTVALILPWPHPDGAWRSILTYEEAFVGLGSPPVGWVTPRFILGAARGRAGPRW